MRADLQVAKENLEVMLDELDEHRACLQEKTKTIDSLREMRDDLVEKVEKKEEVIRNKDGELEGLKNKLDSTEKERDDILHISEKTTSELDDARKSIEEMRELRDSLASEVSKDKLIIETMRNREEELVADNQKCESVISELQEELSTEKKVSQHRGTKIELMRVDEERSISLLKKNHEEIYSKTSAELEEKTVELDAARNAISAMQDEYEANVKQSKEALSLLISEHQAKVKIQEQEEAIASKNQAASKTTDKLVNELRRELALKNRELVEKTNEETQAREKIEKLIK